MPAAGAQLTLMYAMRRFVASSTARGDRVGLLLRADDRRPRHELFRRRDHEHDGDHRDVVRGDAQDLGVVDVDALGGRLELTERVDGRGRDEPVARARRDRALGESDRLLVVAGERDPYERTQTVGLGRDRDHRRARMGREHLRVEHVTAELHDRDDAAVELEPERSECDRLDVAGDLLRVLARMGDHVDFADPTARFGDETSDRDVGEPADLALDLGQIELVHALEVIHGRNPFPAHRRRIRGVARYERATVRGQPIITAGAGVTQPRLNRLVSNWLVSGVGRVCPDRRLPFGEVRFDVLSHPDHVPDVESVVLQARRLHREPVADARHDVAALEDVGPRTRPRRDRTPRRPRPARRARRAANSVAGRDAFALGADVPSTTSNAVVAPACELRSSTRFATVRPLIATRATTTGSFSVFVAWNRSCTGAPLTMRIGSTM